MLFQWCAPVAGKTQRFAQRKSSETCRTPTQWAVLYFCSFAPPHFVALSREQTGITAIQPQDAFLY